MANDLKQTGKFLSLILRRDPAKIGLTLDANGWASVDDLLTKVPPEFGLTRERLAELVEKNEKKRYVFSDDGTRIRANQGHSTQVDLGLAPAQPASVLRFRDVPDAKICAFYFNAIRKSRAKSGHKRDNIIKKSDIKKIGFKSFFLNRHFSNVSRQPFVRSHRDKII